MAKRPIQKKKLARLRKQVNRRPLIAYTNLVWWLKDRGYAQSTREAAELMVDGKVRVGSHAVGRSKELVSPALSALERLQGQKVADPKEIWVAAPLIRAELRDDLRVEK